MICYLSIIFIILKRIQRALQSRNTLISSIRRSPTKQSLPNLRESLNDNPMVFPIIQRQKTMQQLLQIFLIKHLLLQYHLHHRPLEVLVRILRLLHHREALSHFPFHRARYQPLEHRQPRRRLALRRRKHQLPLRDAPLLRLLGGFSPQHWWHLAYGFQVGVELGRGIGGEASRRWN